MMAIVEARSPVQYAKLPAGGGDIAAWSFREASTPEPARPRLLDRVLGSRDASSALDDLAARVASRELDPFTAVSQLLSRAGL